ncbi:MAG TPA: YciI family protein [Fimbriimonas sp.]|nr:YciI family protein [Fimbriimonas sp.]
MATFVLLLTGGDFEKLSAEEMQAAYGKYMGWSKLLRERNQYVTGEELQMVGKTIAPGGIVSDGPFAESKEAVGGFYMITAKDLEEATEIAKDCPQLLYGGKVEVRPTVDHSGA